MISYIFFSSGFRVFALGDKESLLVRYLLGVGDDIAGPGATEPQRLGL